LLATVAILGPALVGCNQIQQAINRTRQGLPPSPTPNATPGGERPTIPYLYTGNSRKATSQDINACASNVRSILASNGYVDSTNESRNEEGSAVWVSGDRMDMGISAEFQCSSNGVTVLAMAGMDNDKLFAEYDRIHNLNW
jgi:hypothetical protein